MYGNVPPLHLRTTSHSRKITPVVAAAVGADLVTRAANRVAAMAELISLAGSWGEAGDLPILATPIDMVVSQRWGVRGDRRVGGDPRAAAGVGCPGPSTVGRPRQHLQGGCDASAVARLAAPGPPLRRGCRQSLMVSTPNESSAPAPAATATASRCRRRPQGLFSCPSAVHNGI